MCLAPTPDSRCTRVRAELDLGAAQGSKGSEWRLVFDCTPTRGLAKPLSMVKKLASVPLTEEGAAEAGQGAVTALPASPVRPLRLLGDVGRLMSSLDPREDEGPHGEVLAVSSGSHVVLKPAMLPMYDFAAGGVSEEPLLVGGMHALRVFVVTGEEPLFGGRLYMHWGMPEQILWVKHSQRFVLCGLE